jgi:type IV pilus assembly protein PilW
MMTTTRSPGSSPGFSLLEMIVATGISAIVVAGGVALLMGQQRMYQSSAGERGLQETARIAMGELETNLRLAGFGVDPPLAIDFGFADKLTMLQAPAVPGATVRNAPGYRCPAAVTCRDSITGPDEIVFYARNPLFGHTLTTVSSATSISISGPLNVPLYKGQILQLMCADGAMPWAYVTVGAYVAKSPGPAAVAVTLSPGPGGAILDFPYQQGLLVDPANDCFKSGLAMVAKVDRFRYFIGVFDVAGGPQTALTPNTRPYLLLDKGLSDETDAPAPPTYIAPDVEDLQFAYLYPRGAVPVVGGTPNAAIAAGPTGIDLAPVDGSPGYGTPTASTSGVVTPSRLNQHPANIRGVRVSIVVRAATADPAFFGYLHNTVPTAGNRPATPGLPNFRRMRLDSTVMMPNMDSRAPFFPFLSTNNGVDQLNVGGG